MKARKAAPAATSVDRPAMVGDKMYWTGSVVQRMITV